MGPVARPRPRSASSSARCSRRPWSGGSARSLASANAGSVDCPGRASTVGEAIAAARPHQRGGRRGPTQPSVPRAMRPCSASSQRSTAQMQRGSMRAGEIGSTPWQPSIGGGSFASYAGIGRPQLQPQLVECCSLGTSESEPQSAACQVSTCDLQTLIEKAHLWAPPDTGVRRHTMCPYMRAKGTCGLPSCPYIHEVCRSRKEHTPLTASNPIYNACAPKACSNVPCRFQVVLGSCPYGDQCAYAHDAAEAPRPGPPPAGSTAKPGPWACRAPSSRRPRPCSAGPRHAPSPRAAAGGHARGAPSLDRLAWADPCTRPGPSQPESPDAQPLADMLQQEPR